MHLIKLQVGERPLWLHIDFPRFDTLITCVIDKGTIVEKGKHEELMQISTGVYKQMVLGNSNGNERKSISTTKAIDEENQDNIGMINESSKHVIAIDDESINLYDKKDEER